MVRSEMSFYKQYVAPFNIEESFNDEISHNEGSVIEISCNERSVIEI